MALWLKTLKENGHPRYSVEQINALPTVIACLVRKTRHYVTGARQSEHTVFG